MPRDQYQEQANTVARLLTSFDDRGEIAVLENLILTAHRVHGPTPDQLASLRTQVDNAQADAEKRSAEADTAFNELVQFQA
jgi:hypothetical protein